MEQAERCIERLRIEARQLFVKTAPDPNRVRYPPRALQEAIVNAIVHRDYESADPTRITVFEDRIEIWSPGGLAHDLDAEALRSGTPTPRWRNQALAWFFQKLGLAQAEGQGIPTIRRLMAEARCPAPEFDVGESHVRCVLRARPAERGARAVEEADRLLSTGRWAIALATARNVIEGEADNDGAWVVACDAADVLGHFHGILELVTRWEAGWGGLHAATRLRIGATLRRAANEREGGSRESSIWAQVALGRILESLRDAPLAADEVAAFVDVASSSWDATALEPWLSSRIAASEALGRDPRLRWESARLHAAMMADCLTTAGQRDASDRVRALARDAARQHRVAALADLDAVLSGAASEERRAEAERERERLRSITEID